MATKVLIMIPHLADGGAERVVPLWAQMLADQGYAVTVLTYFPLPNEYPLDTRVTRVNLVASQDEFRQLKFKVIALKTLLEQYLDKHPQDIILPHILHPNLISALYDDPNVKVVAQTILDSPWDFEQGFNLILRDWAIQKQGVVILQNDEQLKYFNQPQFRKVRKYLVHNPLHPAIAKIEKKQYHAIKKIVAIGRLVPQKNQQLMLETIKVLRDEHHYLCQLDIYGAGEDQAALQQYIDANHLQDQIKLCGFTHDIFQKAVNYDLYLMTSVHEGTPNALLEAMGLGLPAVVTNFRTGAHELINHGVNGYIVDAYDPHALANMILQINDPDNLARIGRQARQDMQRYAMPHCAAELKACLEDLLAHPPVQMKLDPALKLLDKTIKKTNQPEILDIYQQKFFKTTFHIIKTLDRKHSLHAFELAEQYLKHVKITTPYIGPKLYKLCLQQNHFPILYDMIHEGFIS